MARKTLNIIGLKPITTDMAHKKRSGVHPLRLAIALVVPVAAIITIAIWMSSGEDPELHPAAMAVASETTMEIPTGTPFQVITETAVEIPTETAIPTATKAPGTTKTAIPTLSSCTAASRMLQATFPVSTRCPGRSTLTATSARCFA